MDESAAANKRLWEHEAEAGCGYCVPWLSLDPEALRAHAAGTLDSLPERTGRLYPHGLLADVEGRRVHESPCCGDTERNPEPGSWPHQESYLGGEFAVIASRR